MRRTNARAGSIRRCFGAWRRATALAALLVVTAAVYAPVRHHDFIDLDDPQYVAAHPRVQAGLRGDNLVWAFTSVHEGNWIPLTWISHMLDCQVFGLDPGAHHLVNLGFHLANTAVLTGWLLRLTGAFWPSLAVAALFALHPLHVESVAWVAERKDVLSTFFGLLALAAYVRFARRGGAVAWAGVTVCFALSLLAKPMLVTLPALMLLLDVWPLGRLAAAWAPRGLAGAARRRAPGRLLLEKLPWLGLSTLVGAITVHAQRTGGALVSAEALPWVDRVGNAVVAYGTYLLRSVWPDPLAVYYPHPGAHALATVLTHATLLLGLGAVALTRFRRAPFVLFGSSWFVVSLLPVIGLVQVGDQALADRYTYLPLLGIFVAWVWTVDHLAVARPAWRPGLVAAAMAALAVLAGLSHRQVERWRDTRTLFEHTLAVTTGNAVAHLALAQADAREGRLDPAESQLREALRLEPGLLAARYNLGVVLARQGKSDDAIALLREVVAVAPGHAPARVQLGATLARRGQLPEAIAHYEAALQADPDSLEARTNLGVAWAELDQLARAEQAQREVLRRAPGFTAARFNLAMVLLDQGRHDEAAAELERVVSEAPQLTAARLHLAVVRANQGRDDEARTLAEAVLESSPGDAGALRILDFLAARGRAAAEAAP